MPAMMSSQGLQICAIVPGAASARRAGRVSAGLRNNSTRWRTRQAAVSRIRCAGGMNAVPRAGCAGSFWDHALLCTLHPSACSMLYLQSSLIHRLALAL